MTVPKIGTIFYHAGWLDILEKCEVTRITDNKIYLLHKDMEVEIKYGKNNCWYTADCWGYRSGYYKQETPKLKRLYNSGIIIKFLTGVNFAKLKYPALQKIYNIIKKELV